MSRFPSFTIKNPSPWIARSVSLLLDWMAPWVKRFSMPLTRTPKPICNGFVPPRFPDDAPAARSV